MGKLGHAISEELQAAQQRLLRLRSQLHASRMGEDAGPEQPGLFEEAGVVERPFPTPIIAQLPAHLGWESAAFTQTLRQIQPTANPAIDTAVSPQDDSAPPSPSFPETIKMYPDIAIGLLRQNRVAAGRLWLLLQAMDTAGRGWLDETAARELLTSKRGAWRFCGVRQLRNLLAEGETLFWERQDGRIWLRSVGKVAFALGIPRLNMRPVAVPVSVLRQKIGTVRAHLYATFHSSRKRRDRTSSPIARETVARLTEVMPRTQRRYERKARVKRQAQFAIGSQASVANLQARSWQQGHATFEFKDFNGNQGQPGGSYVAWQLPNSYVGPHAQQPKGRQKRINRALTDLFMQGMTGNGQCSKVTRRFFDNGRLAAKSYLRNPAHDHYWRGRGNGRYQLWQVMESDATQ